MRPIHKAPDYRPPDNVTADEAKALFATLLPDVHDPRIDEAHAGMAIAARSLGLAPHPGKLGASIVGDLQWSQRRHLRELVAQAVNHRLGCAYSLRARQVTAEAAGVGAEQQAALPPW